MINEKKFIINKISWNIHTLTFYEKLPSIVQMFHVLQEIPVSEGDYKDTQERPCLLCLSCFSCIAITKYQSNDFQAQEVDQEIFLGKAKTILATQVLVDLLEICYSLMTAWSTRWIAFLLCAIACSTGSYPLLFEEVG